MPGSVGPIKLPIQSTFDPSGIVAAKAGLKELSQTQTGRPGGGGGGASPTPAAPARSAMADEGERIFEQTRTANEKYEYQVRKLDDLHRRGAISTNTYRRAQKQALEILPQSAGWAQRAGLGGAGRALAGEAGIGGIVAGFGAAGPVAAIAAVGIAVYGLTQKIAGQAIAAKDNARALGVSTQYYFSLASSARRAGTDLSTVTNAIGNVQDIAHRAVSGDIGTQAFLATMGIGNADLAASGGNAESLARKMYAAAKTPAQKAAIFGSVAAADATQAAAEPSWYTPSGGETQAATKAKAGMEGMWIKLLGRASMSTEELRTADAEAAKARSEAQGAKYKADRLTHAKEILPGILTPEERYEFQRESAAGLFRDFGRKGEQYQARYDAQLGSARTAAQSPYLSAREVERRELRDWGEKKLAGGFASDGQAYEARLQIQEKADSALSGVQSSRENLATSIARYKDRRLSAITANRNEKGDVDWAKVKLDERDLDRGMINNVTAYAEGITRSGPLAAAADINSTAGYSQIVGAEYQMDQSKDTLNLIAKILEKIAGNTDPKDLAAQSQFKALVGEIGYQFQGDPFSLVGR